MNCDEFIAKLSASGRPTTQVAAHGERCPQCARLWEAEMLLRSATPDARAIAPAASPQLRQLFAAQHGTTRSSHPLRRILAVLTAVLAGIACSLWGLPRADLRVAGIALLVVPFAAFALALLAGLQLYIHRGRAGLGMPPWLRWAFAGLAVVLFEGVTAIEVAKSAAWSSSLGAARVAASTDCLALGLVVASFVGIVTLSVGRRMVLVGAASAGALAGSIAGLAAVMFLHLHCASSDAGHLSVVHVLPLVCAIAAGTFAGRRILAA